MAVAVRVERAEAREDVDPRARGASQARNAAAPRRSPPLAWCSSLERATEEPPASGNRTNELSRGSKRATQCRRRALLQRAQIVTRRTVMTSAPPCRIRLHSLASATTALGSPLTPQGEGPRPDAARARSDPWLLAMKRSPDIMAVEVLKLARAEGCRRLRAGGRAAGRCDRRARRRRHRVRGEDRRRPARQAARAEPSLGDVALVPRHRLRHRLLPVHAPLARVRVRGLNAPDFARRTCRARGRRSTSSPAPSAARRCRRSRRCRSAGRALLGRDGVQDAIPHAAARVDGDDASGTKKGGLVRWGAPDWRYFLADLSGGPAAALAARLRICARLRQDGRALRVGRPRRALHRARRAPRRPQRHQAAHVGRKLALLRRHVARRAARCSLPAAAAGRTAPPDAAATAALGAKLGDAAARMAASLPIRVAPRQPPTRRRVRRGARLRGFVQKSVLLPRHNTVHGTAAS